MKRNMIKYLLEQTEEQEQVLVKGWVRTKRDSKTFSFLELNDGSCLANIQIIVDETTPNYSDLDKVTTGAAVVVSGKLVASPGKNQKWEIHASGWELLGAADSTFPLQKKRHSLEYLREIAHLRPRSNMFGAIFRIRSRLAYAIHQFFQQRDFNYIHTPIITASDCEGAGELFKVTTLDPLAKKEEAPKDYKQDFFGKPAFLTVSGQLEGEVFASALGNIYTFGPTFRAENSNTSRHVSEFWMIEPEMAFYDLEECMDLAEEFIKYLIKDIRQECAADLELFSKFVDKSLMKRLDLVEKKEFKRIAYKKAIDILIDSGKKFEFPVSYGIDLQTEHEKFLTEQAGRPIVIFDYPKTIKPFYMRRNDDDETVAAMDVLVPGIGEIIGGSQREERLDVLQKTMEHDGLSAEEYWWYLDLRKYGSVPHSGFGLGFERLLMFITGTANIRDVVPFARTPNSIDF